MQNVSLGNTTIKVSRVAFGCWRIGDIRPGKKSPPDEAAGRRAVISAYEAGINFFDHADIYSEGRGELIFGQVLRQVHRMRDEVVIASKCGIRKAGDPVATAPYRYDFSASYLIKSCERSLKRLGVDRIDLYQLHRPDFLMEPEEVAGAFAKLQRQGKVREFGVSNFSPWHVAALQRACPMRLIVNQIEVSLAQLRCFHDGTLDQCLAEKMSPLAWSPLAGGLLADGARKVLPTQEGYYVKKINKALDRMAKERNVPRAAMALAWLMRHPSGIIPIIGSTDAQRITDCAAAANIELTREEWYELFSVARAEPLP